VDQARFRWSRAHADNLIGLYLNRGKLLKFSSLPISALYLLTKASPKLIQKIEQDVEAGERLFVREIQRQTRAERTSITYTSSTEPSSTRRVMNLTAPQEEPTKPQRVITAEDINEGFGLLHAGLALRQLETFWAWFVGVPPDKFTAMLPASQHKRLRQVLHAIIALSNSHLEKLWEAGKPRLVSDEGDGR
jgi:hypothetical protein